MTLSCNPSSIRNELDEGQAKQVLLKMVEREPGVVFDIMKDPEQGPVRGESPNWCSGDHCLEIATDIERLFSNMRTTVPACNW